jgi:hypothetical protein
VVLITTIVAILSLAASGWLGHMGERPHKERGEFGPVTHDPMWWAAVALFNFGCLCVLILAIA